MAKKREPRTRWARLGFALPDEQWEFELAAHATDWYCVVSDMAEFLRQQIKYGHEWKRADDALAGVRVELFRLLTERGLSVD